MTTKRRIVRRIELEPSDEQRSMPLPVQIEYGKHGGVSFELPTRHIGYLDEFIRRRASTDLLRLGIFPDAKEVTEAEGIRRAISNECQTNLKDTGILIIASGDGKKSRLGHLLAYTTAWTTVSIDPLAVEVATESKRVHVIARRIEEVDDVPEQWIPEKLSRIIVTAPHSHGKLDNAVKVAWKVARKAGGEVTIDAVALACCVRQSIAGRERCDQLIEDLGIWSGGSQIQIWLNLEKG